MKAHDIDQYWGKKYKDFQPLILDSNHPIKKWINNYIPDTKSHRSVLEIGAFPGNFLTLFSEKGYTVSGLDTYPGIETVLKKWFSDLGYKVGFLKKGDFLTWETKELFDIVCSFGLIEHFDNYAELIEKHTALVAEGGYLVIETPNFRGLAQRSLHWFLDRANYERHNIKSMDPKEWESIVKGAGFEVLYCGYFGGFEFWVEQEERSKFKQLILDFVVKKLPKLKKVLVKDNSLYSPFVGIIAKKVR